jgi:hypothetical protein
VATKTSGEIEQEFIENLKKSTGRSLKEWMSTLGEFGTRKRNDIVKRLKEKNGFGHMHATLLAGIYLNAGKAVYGSTEDLLENQFAKAEVMRPLYESFIAFVTKHFPRSSVLPKKSTYLFWRSENSPLSISSRWSSALVLIWVRVLSTTR